MHKGFIIIILLTLTSCYNIERNCNDYKTGTFEFDYIDNGEAKKGFFVRTETLNIDYFNNTIDTASVRWINDCEFIQKKLHPKNQKEQVAIHMKILTTSKDSYTFEYAVAAPDGIKTKRVEKGTAYKTTKVPSQILTIQ